jgi:hypothetical protein
VDNDVVGFEMSFLPKTKMLITLLVLLPLCFAGRGIMHPSEEDLKRFLSSKRELPVQTIPKDLPTSFDVRTAFPGCCHAVLDQVAVFVLFPRPPLSCFISGRAIVAAAGRLLPQRCFQIASALPVKAESTSPSRHRTHSNARVLFSFHF